MSKTTKNSWKTIKFEEFGANIPNADFEGLAGFEECEDYGVVKRGRQPKTKKTKGLKRKSNPSEDSTKVKKPKIAGQFVRLRPSNDTEPIKAKPKKKNTKKVKPGAVTAETDELKVATEDKPSLSESMNGWLSFGIHESILKGLADQKFSEPTAIQKLTLPSAMHGRRDIMGAAETGSGKTLAFGIPIINGILDLKEKIARGENINLPEEVVQRNIEDNSKPKIVNMNKLSKSEVRKLMKETRHKYVEPDSDNSDEENEGENTDDDSEGSASENDDDSEGSASENDDVEASESDSDAVEEDKPVETEIAIKPMNLKPLYALVLTPTRELAIQVQNHLITAAKYTDIRVAVVVGGMAQVKQERILSKCPEIVVATPGRLWEMIQQGNEHLSQVADIRYLAIDETDRMIERGHFEELHHLLDKINDNDYKRGKRQNFVFSATLTMVHDLPFHLKVRKVSKKGKLISKKIEKLTPEQKLKKVIEMLGINNPKVVDVTRANQGASETLTECRITCPIDHKDYYLYYVLKRHPGRTIIFCNSIGCVKRLAQLFGLLQCNLLPLHANMQQRQRLKNLDRFRDDPNGLLVATDVAARGLDIPDVDHVIHYQVPRTAENYVHRSGRTARANKEGITILIMEPSEVQNYIRMCRTLSKTEDLPHFPVPDAFLPNIRSRVNLAREIDHLELQIRKLNSEVGWYEKNMKEMDIILDERDMPTRIDKDLAREQKSALNNKRKELNSMLSSHLFPKGFSFKYPTSNSGIFEDMAFSAKQNALEAMKLAMESGLVKKLKKSSRNEAAFSLIKDIGDKVNKENKIAKNKWKKMKRTKKST